MADNAIVLRWATAISRQDDGDRQIIWRFAQDFRTDFDRASQPDRIIIAWRYSSQTGQPQMEEHQRMNVMEDLLEGVLDEPMLATLALVSTGEGLREWTYYSRSESEFMAHLNYAFIGHEPFSIDIHIANDPAWEMYNTFRNGMKQSR